jgi:hypothetical protein
MRFLQPEQPDPPQRRETGGACVCRKTQTPVLQLSQTATQPQQRDNSSLPTLCQRRGSHPPHTPIARTASIV